MSESGQPPSKKICVRSSALSIQPDQAQDKGKLSFLKLYNSIEFIAVLG